MRASITILDELSPADGWVFAAVLLATLGAVIWGNLRRRHLPVVEGADLLDLLLMGRRLTLPLFTATLVATWYGGILPVTEYAFEYGLYSWVTQGAFWYAAYIIFAFCLVAGIRRTEARTMPELLSGLFGPRSGTLGAWFNLFNVLPVIYVLSLGKFLQMMFGGDLFLWMCVGTAVVVAYSTFGGLRSVVYSDVVQFVVMCAAVVLVIVFSVHRFGGIAWLRASELIPAAHWKPLGEGIPLGSTFVWGLVALGTLVDPNFYQRCLAAKDARTARNGILLSTLIWFAFDFCTTFGAFYARAAIPGADKSTAYLVYGVQLLPSGLRGFFLAGVLATILSTLDSYLFLSGTVAAYDLAPRRWKGSVAFHHVGTILMAVIAVFVTRFFLDRNMVDIWKFFGGLGTACLLAPMMIGQIFPRRISDRVFVTASLAGAAAMLLFVALQSKLPAFWKAMEPFYLGLTLSLLVCLSGLRKPQPPPLPKHGNL